MVLKPEPIFRALDAIEAEVGAPLSVVLTSPQGTPFTQEVAQRLSREKHIVLLCGRYEGVDERVRARVGEEISIGDYVLSGGELPALVIVEAVSRLVPGVVGDEQSVAEDSFSRGLLDFPQYTRPAELKPSRPGPVDAATAGPVDRAAPDPDDRPGLKVPDVLLSGNHAEIRRWRKREAVARTLARRPELLTGATLDEEEQEILRELVAQRDKGEEHGRH
jgi:tRNA (guanine37-N1)-methyltransferase